MAKLNKSWERDLEKIHSPQGVKELRAELKDAMVRRYTGMSESMFRWEFPDECFTDFIAMTRDDEPEKTLMRSGQGVFFRIPHTDQVTFLPLVFDAEINIHGNPIGWHPVPVGWTVTSPRNDVFSEIMDLKLNVTNSVLMRDSVYTRSDLAIIRKAVDALVDNYLTLNQLSLLAKCPFIFNVSDNAYLDAKNFFLALSEDKPMIIRRAAGDEMEQSIEATNSAIDTGLFDVIRQWENMLLEQLGIPGSQKTQKRAQQSLEEVEMGDDLTTLRRKEKLRFREKAVERLNDMFGTHVTVTSLIDEMHAERDGMKEDMEDDDDGE